MQIQKLFLLTYVISFVLIPHFVFAQVTLYISPSDLASESETYAAGQTIEARVLIDTREERIGVGKGVLRFSGEHLEVTAISKESSIFTLWIEEPQVVGNRIRFVGGVPGGFSGRGEIFSVTFRTKTDATVGVLFDSVRVLSFEARPKDVLRGTGEAWYPFKIPNAIPDDFLFNNALEKGNRNIDVAYLQRALASEGLYDGDITGRFDEETERAVKQFQERYLDQRTGVVEEFTRAKLNDLLPEIREREKLTLFDILVAPEREGAPARTTTLLIIVTGIGIALAFVFVVGVPKIRRWWGKRQRAKRNNWS